MKNLYFVRHGLSQANIDNLWSGSGLNSPLSEEGKLQATQAGKSAKSQGLVFDIVISSPQDRAHHTAKNITTELNYLHDDIVLHNNFVERGFGELEGVRSKPETFKSYSLDESSIDKLDGVEKLVQLQNRANEALNYLNTLPYDTILVVAHGAFGRALRRAVNNEPFNIPLDPIPNAVIIKLI